MSSFRGSQPGGFWPIARLTESDGVTSGRVGVIALEREAVGPEILEFRQGVDAADDLSHAGRDGAQSGLLQ